MQNQKYDYRALGLVSYESIKLFPNPNDYKLWSWFLGQVTLINPMLSTKQSTEVDLYRSEIMSHTGMSRNTVTACMSNLERYGVISATKRQMSCVVDVNYVCMTIKAMLSAHSELQRNHIANLFHSGCKETVIAIFLQLTQEPSKAKRHLTPITKENRNGH